MKDLIEKLTAIEGKKQLNEASQWEEDTRGLDQPPAPIGEAGPPSIDKVYPNTRNGVLEYMQYGYNKSFLRKLDLPTCKVHADPQVDGVWAVDSMASGFRCIIYLAGYNDPWGQKRTNNDNEEGSFTLPYMKKLIEQGLLDPKRMKHWVKCDSIDESTLNNLMKFYNYHNGIDEALLSGPTQRSPEPDWDEDSYGDPDSDNYCDSCGENFPMDYDSCPNCTDEVDEATNHMGEPEYHSFHGWRAACRKVDPTVWFDGDKEIAQAMVGMRPYRRGETHSIGEWDGAVGVVYNNDTTMATEGDSGWDEEDEPGWMSGPEDTRDWDTAPGGHDDLATRDLDEASGGLWKVTYWVEEKSYSDAPGREYEDSVTVRANSAQEAFEMVKARPKQTGKMRYDFKVVPAQDKELDEVFDSPSGQAARKSYQKKAGEAIRKAQLAGDRSTLEKRATGVARSYQPPKQRQSAFQTSEGKTTMRNKKTISESADFGNAPPELVKILRHFGKEVADFQQGGELDDSLYDALYDYYFDDMPYGTKKARTGDPYEWIADRLDQDISGPKFGDVTDKYMASQAGIADEGAAGDIMPLESVEDNPFNDDPAPGSEDDDKYGYPGFFGQNDLNKNSNERSLARQEEFMGLADSVGDSVELEPQPGEEIVTELQSNDESKITDMLSNIGLDHGLDFWFEGDEIVVIGRKEAKLVTTTVGGHIQSVDGEEFRIGMNPRAAKAAPSDINDLAAMPELGEGKMSELDIERKEKREKAAKEAREKKAKEAKAKKEKADLKEEVSVDDVEMLTMKLKSGQLTYDQFREKLDSLEHTDYSMRQGEMGLQGDDTPAGNRHFQADQDDYDEFGVDDEFGDGDEFEEGQFANSAEEPAQPEVHTSTTAMINQGDDLNRPKKQSWPMRNKGDNPMAEARGLMKQYNAMKAAISLK
jgi:hypothetical protein